MTDDVLCLGVPLGIDPLDPDVLEELSVQLNGIVVATVWGQWPGTVRPLDVRFEETTWLITRNIEDVDLFQPAHDCAQCHQGNESARTYLTENPGRWVAMANIRYEEVWAA